MGENSKIEWTHHTFNPWRGCTKVSPGCTNCYAEQLSKRNPTVLGIWGPKGTRVVASESMWRQPLKWDQEARKSGERRRVFCASLADVFEDRPELVAPRDRLFDLIEATPNLDWLLLTKRPENAAIMASGSWGNSWPSNVWFGTSVENQEAADKRIPELLKIPSAVRFLSCEPLLGPVDLLHVDAAGFGGPPGHKIDCIRKGFWSRNLGFVNHSDMHDTFGALHWVIAGGESGPNARPMHPDWARSLRDQCQAAGVAFHFKQWGEWAFECQPTDADEVVQACLGNPNGRWLGPNGEETHENWDTVYMLRVGKKAAGRLLDGVEHNGFPNTKAATP